MSQLVVIVLEAEDFARDHVGESPLPACYGIFSGALTEFLRMRVARLGCKVLRLFAR
jgi:hypothetical protein